MGVCCNTADRRAGAKAMLLAACAFAGLAGCGQTRVERPELGMGIPSQWAETGHAAGALDPSAYWHLLDDPVLTQFVESAAISNLDIAQAAARVEQARAALRGRRAEYLPQISASGAAQRDIGNRSRDDVQFSLGADGSWEADLFGRIGFDLAVSEAQLAAAGYSLADFQRVIVGQVALATISARATALQLDIARDTLAVQDENLQIARWRVQAGLVSSLDVEQARGQRAQTAATIPLLEADLAATANAISTLIGEPPGRVLALLRAPAQVPDPPALAGFEAPADVLRRRPDVRGAEATLIADTARIGVARAQLLPLVRLGGTLGSSSFGLGNLFDVVTGNVFASVSQLIFDGGRTRAAIDSARAAAEGSLAAWRLSILEALEDVESAAADLRAAGERVRLYGEALEAASNSALLARSQYQAGLTDFRNLLLAENELLFARNARVSAEAERASAFVRLTQALGGGWTPAEYPLPVSDRTQR